MLLLTPTPVNVSIAGRLNGPYVLKHQPFEHFRRQLQHRQAGSRCTGATLGQAGGQGSRPGSAVEITFAGIGAHDNQRLISWVIG